MRRIISALLLSIVALALVCGWAQTKSVDVMSDEELKAAIDSLVKEEQPLSVAPLIAEAKRRAAQAKDTKWMLDIIKKDVKVNARRLSREASAEQLIRKYRDDAWTPLRQIISAECYLIGFNVADARDALSAPAELRRFKAADVDDEASIADMNLLDYVCASFALNNKYEAISINTQPRLDMFCAPSAAFAASSDTLPVGPSAVRVMAREAILANDDESLAIAQALRVVLASYAPAASADSLVAELAAMRPTGRLGSALVELAKATALVSGIKRDCADVQSDDAKISKALGILRNVANEQADNFIGEYAGDEVKRIEKAEVYVKSESQVMPGKFTPVCLSYRNVKNAAIRIFRIGSSIPENDANVKAADALDGRNIVCSKDVRLPQTASTVFLSSAYTELDGLEPGYYAIAVYPDGAEKPSAVGTFFCSSISPSLISVGREDYMLVSDYETGMPLSDVKVGGKASLDKDGWMKWAKAPGVISMSRNGDFYSAYMYSYHSQKGDEYDHDQSVQLITDRGIYRPGQTISFKVYFFDRFTDHLSPFKSGKNCKVLLVGANGKELASVALKLDEFGSASGKIDVPADVLKGRCFLKATCGKVVHFDPIQVEDFKRSDNTVAFKPFDNVVLPGSFAMVSGTCTSAAGLPVANAKVAYEYNGGSLSSLSSGETTTDADGAFSFSFKVTDGVYNISARVTDSKGETAGAATSLTVDPRGFDVGLAMDSEWSSVGAGPKFRLTSLNSNGCPFTSRVRVRVTPYEPLKSLSPAVDFDADTVIGDQCHVIFGRPTYYNNKPALAAKPVFEHVYDVNGGLEVDLSDSNLPARRYKVEAFADALDSSKLYASSVYMAIADEGRMSGLDYLSLYAPTSVKSGSTLDFSVGSGLIGARALVIVSQRGEMILRRHVELSSSISKFSLPVSADCVNGESLRIMAIVQKDGERHVKFADVTVLKEEEQLALSMSSFRDHSRPGAKEVWTINCSGHGDKSIAASMYDSRLDKYVDNSWSTHFDRLPVGNRVSLGSVQTRCYSLDGLDGANGHFWSAGRMSFDLNILSDVVGNLGCKPDDYEAASEFYCLSAAPAMALGENKSVSIRGMGRMAKVAADVQETADEVMVEEDADYASVDAGGAEVEPLRENFAETVFFLPNITPDAEGNATFEFTLPDNLTTYNFRALVVDKQLRSASVTKSVVVNKPVNVRIGAPRFVSEGDTLFIPVDVTVTDSSVSSAVVSIKVIGKETDIEVKSVNNVSVDLGGVRNGRAGCDFVVPEGVENIIIEASASAMADGRATGDKDGERVVIPVALRNVEVDEVRSFAITGKGVHKLHNPFTDGNMRSLSFNYSSNAFIEVLRALPTLDNNRYPSADTYLGRYECAAIASMLSSKPHVQKAVAYLKNNMGKLNTVGDSDRNTWYLMARRIAKHDKELVRLLPGGYADKTKSANLRKLQAIQLPDGSFPWFSGMDGSEWMTVGVVATLGEMTRLGLVDESDMPVVSKMTSKAMPYVDKLLERQLADYDAAVSAHAQNKKAKKAFAGLSSFALETLHARVLLGGKFSGTVTRMADILKHNWQYQSMCDRVTAVTILDRLGDQASALKIVKSLEENLVQTKDGTAYIPENGLFHRRQQVEAQAMLVFALQRLNPASSNAQKVINHLMLMKRGEAWPDAQSTSRAVLALLASSATGLAEVDQVQVGDIAETCSVENPNVTVVLSADGSVSKVEVRKGGKATSWGSWSRVIASPVDQLKADGSDKLKVSRSIDVRHLENGQEVWEPVGDSAALKVGDQVRVTLKFYNDEPLSFVRVRDFRTASVEPEDKLSGYRGWWFWRWTDANVSTPCHYLSVSDKATEFFIDYLYEGWHSVSYKATVTHEGDFSGGYADAQCMYATEILSHTDGCRLSVKD